MEKNEQTVERTIEQGWMKVSGQPILDLEKYILDQLASDPEITILIGTDSKKSIVGYQEQDVKYLSVVCFRKPNKGAHVIKRIENTHYNFRISLGERLGYEIDLSSRLAIWIREKINLSVEVHLDINPDASAGSHEVYKMYKGYFESMQFPCEYKPDSAAAQCVADYYLG